MVSWILREDRDSISRPLEEGLGISGLQARLLVNRGIVTVDEARRFLEPAYGDLHDPFLFSEMEKAVGILSESVALRKRILVHGDYDADGISGTALLFRVLRGMGADVRFFVPNRAKDGYGLARRVMERGIEVGQLGPLDLVISVDCGSSDDDVVSFLADRGVRTIITDHHEIAKRVPRADAFINPKLPSEKYPFAELAGVGVAFKLLQALEIRTGASLGLEKMLDYVAVGTLGDYSLLQDENRVLVSLGMKRLAEWDNPGFAALQRESNLPSSGFTARQVCFTIVPRLNSPGRVGSARDVVELLVTDDHVKAASIAAKIENVNSTRKSLDSVVTEQACNLADVEMKKGAPSALVYSSDAWHEGVVGIGAARLAEKYSLPSVLIAVNGDYGKGSARSAGLVNIKEALESCSRYLTLFGGHREAGGFTLPEKNIPDFRIMFDRVVGGMLEKYEDRNPVLFDSRVALGQCDMELASMIENMSPFGPGNEEPLLLIEGLKVLDGSRIVGNDHLKIMVSDESGAGGELIGFSLGRAWNPVDLAGKRIEVLANIRKNKWQGREEPQVQVLKIRLSGREGKDS